MLNVQYFYRKLSDEQKTKLRNRVEKKINRIKRFFSDTDTQIDLHITVDIIGGKTYQVELRCPQKSLFVKREADVLLQAFEIAYSDFKEKLLKRVNDGKRVLVINRRAKQFEKITAEKKKLDAEHVSDYTRLKPLLKPLRRYIIRLLRANKIRLNELSVTAAVEDILNEVLAQAYEKQPSNLNLEEWLYQLANQVIDKLLAEYSQTELFRSVEDIKRMELKQLEEVITADADGELVLVDELDSDVSYHYKELDLPKENTDYIEQLARNHEILEVTRAMSLLEDQERKIIELVVFEGYAKDRVAEIMEISEKKVNTLYKKAKSALIKSLQKTNN